MKKQESEKAVRHLCSEWAEINGVKKSAAEEPSFYDFYDYVKSKYPQCLKFRSTLPVSDQVEAWFDDEFKQRWRS